MHCKFVDIILPTNYDYNKPLLYHSCPSVGGFGCEVSVRVVKRGRPN